MTQAYEHGRKIEAPERSILLPLRLHDLPSPGTLGCLFELLTPEPSSAHLTQKHAGFALVII